MSLISIVELGGISPGKTKVIIASLLAIIFWDSVCRMGLISIVNPVTGTEKRP